MISCPVATILTSISLLANFTLTLYAHSHIYACTQQCECALHFHQALDKYINSRPNIVQSKEICITLLKEAAASFGLGHFRVQRDKTWRLQNCLATSEAVAAAAARAGAGAAAVGAAAAAVLASIAAGATLRMRIIKRPGNKLCANYKSQLH